MNDWRIIESDCVEAMQEMPEASVDAVVCDPPYGLGFMGHEWDQPGVVIPPRREGVPSGNGSRRRTPREGTRRFGDEGSGAKEAGRYDLSRTALQSFQAWCEAWATGALRVLKPGGHLLAFGGTRTYHRLACAIEDAGFEIRDCLAWMYGQGFPKSLDVSKAIDKAAGAEREVVGQRTDGRYAHGFSEDARRALGSAHADEQGMTGSTLGQITAPAAPEAAEWSGWGTALKPAHEPIVLARKPFAGTVAANVLEHGTGALNVDGCRIAGDEDGSRNRPPSKLGSDTTYAQDEWTRNAVVQRQDTTGLGRWPANVLLDEEAAGMLDEQSGTLQSGRLGPENYRGQPRFKNAYGDCDGNARATERSFGGDSGGASRFFYIAKASRAERGEGNTHPTVKPVELMCWLVRLITPSGGTVLDPFCGSGTTGIAALREGFSFIGIEREPEYAEIARARIRSDQPLFNVGSETTEAA